jgi:alpha-L-rhamnosidase
MLTACTGALKPVRLQCEYRSEPLGIDVETPRFSWQMLDENCTRGQKQTAFHILAASSPELLTESRADVWNSGRISSPQSLSVPFAGKKLTSSHAYFWKVQVFDKDGKPSAWSDPARFVTGILNPAEWDPAAWIRHPDAPRTRHIWFRRNLTLDADPQAVFAHVASLAHHELYVNGQKADSSVLAPALTNLDKNLFYVTYDISKLLAKGDNVIAVWFAPGWASYYCFNKTPGLRVLVAGTDNAGNAVALASDTAWRCAESCSEDSRAEFIHHNNGGEIVDARKWNPEWNRPGFDDSPWSFAARMDCDVTLIPQDIDPSRIIETIPAQKITCEGDSIYKVDFGKNFTGWLSIRFRGLSEGDTVTIHSADDAQSLCDYNIRSRFISSGKDGESFCHRFNYMAGRYANIEGLRQKPEPEDFTAHAVGTGLRRTGSFRSSNDLFNRIYEADLRTFLANTTEGYTSDCPLRERMGYGELAFACGWGIGFPNYDAGAFYRKTVRDWRDRQTPDGWGGHTAPQPNPSHWGGPLWSGAGMNVAWLHYVQYGDADIVRLIYPAARRWLEFIHANVQDGFLMPYRTQNPAYFLGEWLAPGPRNEYANNIQSIFFNNCVYAMELEIFIRFARILGNAGDEALYAGRLAGLRPAIHARFYHPETAGYMDGTQVQNAIALLTGVAPESERAAVAASIHRDMNGAHPFLDMGSAGIVFLMSYLVDHPEEGETVAKILNKTAYPGYGHFLERGESTWPECWEVDVPSKIHACYTGIAGWFTKGLCGIRPDRENPGYRTCIIRPVIVSEADFAEATVESPYGPIASRWERKGNRLTLSVIIPPNSEARIYIPASAPEHVTESGICLDKSKEIIAGNIKDGYMPVSVGAGRYCFSSTVEAARNE